jgi:predicted kinase
MTAKLLVVAGPPCAGKSTLAAAIEKEFGFRWLETDRVLSALIPGSDRRKSHRAVAYRATLVIAEELLNYSHSVVLDATYSSAEYRHAVRACASRLEVPFYLIQCRVLPEVAVARFKRRIDHLAIDLNERRILELVTRYRYGEYALNLVPEMSLADALGRVKEYLQKAEPIISGRSW